MIRRSDIITEGQPNDRSNASTYHFVRYASKDYREAIFQDGDGALELFFRNRGHASWGLRFRGTDWEFVRSLAEQAQG